MGFLLTSSAKIIRMIGISRPLSSNQNKLTVQMFFDEFTSFQKTYHQIISKLLSVEIFTWMSKII